MAGFDQGIKVFFGGDTTRLKASLADAENAVGKFAGSLAKKFEGRDLARGLATALGLSVDKIAEKVARFFTGMSKEAEAAYGKLGQLTDQLTEKIIAAGTARLSTEKQYELAQINIAQLEKKIAENRGKTIADQVRLTEDKIKLIDREKEAASLLDKIQTKAADQRMAQDKVVYEARMQYFENEKNEREKKAKEAFDDDLKWYKERAKLEKTLKEQKLEALKPEERVLALTKEVNDLKKQQTKFTKEDNEYLSLQVQINDTNKSIEQERLAIAAATAKEEKKITEEKKQQLGAIAGIRGGADFNDASDATLQEISRRNRNQAQAIRANPFNQGIGQSLEAARYEAEAMNAEAELRFRKKFQLDFSVGGEGLARKNFQGDPLEFDRLVDQFIKTQSVAEKTLTVQEDILEALTRRGILTFPAKNLPTGP